MVRLFVQYLANYSIENLPNGIIFAKLDSKYLLSAK